MVVCSVLLRAVRMNKGVTTGFRFPKLWGCAKRGKGIGLPEEIECRSPQPCAR